MSTSDLKAFLLHEGTKKLVSSEKKAVNKKKRQIASKRTRNGANCYDHRKIFVGGLTAEHTFDQIIAYFSQFGYIWNETELKSTLSYKRRGFCFIVFENSKAASFVAFTRFHRIGQGTIECKAAFPLTFCRKKKDTADKQVYLNKMSNILGENMTEKYFAFKLKGGMDPKLEFERLNRNS